MCVASSDRPAAFPKDTAIAKLAIRTQKICPVVLTNSRDGAFPMSCEQHTAVYAALMPQVSGGLDAFFEGAEVLRAMCPRCGRRYNIDREQFEAWIAERA